jgi:hypothetical protein
LYPGDVGVAGDPTVVFVEDFEGALEDVIARWEFASLTGLAILPEGPAGSPGATSIAMTAGGGGLGAAELYRRISPHDGLFVRYYAKYGGGAGWGHAGIWIGGYNPSSTVPRAQEGVKPSGDDLVSVAFQPIGPENRLDFYNYWMTMHAGALGSYQGNTLVHDRDLTLVADAWFCVELWIHLQAGYLMLWKDDVSIVEFSEYGARGYWVQDSFCPDGIADDDTCQGTEPPPLPHEVLDLAYRTTPDLQLNWIWPRISIPSGPARTVLYDHLVVATRRIGCLR